MTVPSLKLFLSENPAPEAVRFEFRHHRVGEEQLVCVRGKTGGAFQSRSGTFQWTSAVVALSVLILRTKAVGGDRAVSIEGGAGSLASSLDYALGKPPGWLLELFGSTAQGDANARYMFRRTNPERKRPGPTAVAINEIALPSQAIEIYIDGRPVLDSAELQCLAETVEQRWCAWPKVFGGLGAGRVGGENDGVAYGGGYLKRFAQSLRQELISTVYLTDLFTERGYKNALGRPYRDPQLLKITKRRIPMVDQIDLELSDMERLGVGDSSVVRKKLSGDRPLRFAVPVGHLGSLMIFNYLRDIKGYNIEIDYNYQYAIQIKDRILSGSFAGDSPDGCMMGIAPAGDLVHRRRSGYRPLMFLPGMIHQVVAPGGASHKSQRDGMDLQGQYRLISDEPSTSSFYFHNLVERGFVNLDRSDRPVHTEPNQTFRLLRDGDPDSRAILFFPYVQLNCMFNGCRIVDHRPNPDLNYKDAVLFLRESLWGDPLRVKCLNIAVRDAWLELRKGGAALDTAVEALTTDADYISAVCRSAGMDAEQLKPKLQPFNLERVAHQS